MPVVSPECPREVYFPLSKSDLERQAEGVWLFYPPDLAQSLGFAMRSVWSEDDSLVDWMMEFVENERDSKSPRIIRHASPVGWSFYRPSVDGILPQVDQPIPSDISKAAAVELEEVAAEAELSEMNVNLKSAASLTETEDFDIDTAAAREVPQEQEVVNIKAAAEVAAESSDTAAVMELPQEHETVEIKVAAPKPVDVNTDVEKAAAAFDVGEENEVLASEWQVTATDTEIAVRILEENFIASCDHRLGRTSVYETYIALVSAISPVRKPLSAGKFYKLVRAVYPHVSDKTPRVNGKPVRSFIGIAYCDGSSEQK